jgi:hypothetical protein
VFVLVLAALLLALRVGMRRHSSATTLPTSPRRLTQSVAAAVAATIVTLILLLVAGVWTSRHMSSLQAASAVSISTSSRCERRTSLNGRRSEQ